MDKTEAINVAFLAGVIIVLVAAFVYVNAFYEVPEEEEDTEEETESLMDLDIPAFDTDETVVSTISTSIPSCLDNISHC